MLKLSSQLVRRLGPNIQPNILSLGHLHRFAQTMATSSKVQLALAERGVMKCPGATVEIARTASEILQENHERHHIFFNSDGFHVRQPDSIRDLIMVLTGS